MFRLGALQQRPSADDYRRKPYLRKDIHFSIGPEAHPRENDEENADHARRRQYAYRYERWLPPFVSLPWQQQQVQSYELARRGGDRVMKQDYAYGLPAIVFDVNETLLDLDSMQPIFERIFGEKSMMRLWFADLILYSEALTLTGTYVPFTDIGAAVMQMLADTRGITINDADKKQLTHMFATMPPHPEVPGALLKLRNAGFQLHTLTDNTLAVQTEQLRHGGILPFFGRRFSADSARHHKPSPQAYAYVENQLGLMPSQLFLIASHTWDTIGAVSAGWGAALIKRPGNDVLGVGPQPTLVGNDLDDVADQLIQLFQA